MQGVLKESCTIMIKGIYSYMCSVMGRDNKYVSRKVQGDLSMKKVRKFLAAVLAVATSLSMSVPTFAAEAVSNDENTPIVAEASIPGDNGGDVAMPMTSGGKNCYGVGCYWYEIISQEEGRGGINATVNVQVISPGYNGSTMSMDVKLYDANYMEVWSGTNMEWISSGFKFWCGPNVTRVAMRIRQPNNADNHFTVSVNWVDGVRT